LSSFLLAIKQQWTIKISSPPFFYFELGGHFGWKSGSPNCSILSQNVSKFELYKHNDELFNIITGFFMNFELLPILTDYAN
jgi:hypothetical protein